MANTDIMDLGATHEPDAKADGTRDESKAPNAPEETPKLSPSGARPAHEFEPGGQPKPMSRIFLKDVVCLNGFKYGPGEAWVPDEILGAVAHVRDFDKEAEQAAEE